MTADYRLEIINNQAKLENLVGQLASIGVLSLDIETIEWWNRQCEQVALIQLAFRPDREIKVVVIDTLAEINTEALRPCLESDSTIKVIHNAAFDAVKLHKFYQMKVSPVFDTMLAARRNGEKKYSLVAQSPLI